MKAEAEAAINRLHSPIKTVSLAGMVMAIVGYFVPWFYSGGWFYSSILLLEERVYFVIPAYLFLLIALVLSIGPIRNNRHTLWFPVSALIAAFTVIFTICIAVADLYSRSYLSEPKLSFGLILLFPGLSMAVFGSISSWIIQQINKQLKLQDATE